MELRDIEIFLTLAEELHFGRTAERLHITHARVSQVIKKQERTIGAELFYRTSRQVRLTPIGEQLRNDLRPVYRELHESVRRAGLAARGMTGVLRVGMIPGNAHDLRAHWQTFRARYPQWDLRIRHVPFIDPFAALRDARVDVLVTWLPVEEPDLIVGPVLFTDPRVLAVAALPGAAARPSSARVDAVAASAGRKASIRSSATVTSTAVPNRVGVVRSQARRRLGLSGSVAGGRMRLPPRRRHTAPGSSWSRRPGA